MIRYHCRASQQQVLMNIDFQGAVSPGGNQGRYDVGLTTGLHLFEQYNYTKM